MVRVVKSYKLRQEGEERYRKAEERRMKLKM